MPYKNLKDLPESVQHHLPEHAQEIYKEAYNSAWEQYDEPDERADGRTREETAHAVAWSAVKKVYEKPADASEEYQWRKKERDD